MVKRRDLPVRVHSDSSYAIGVLDGSYRAKANRELVDTIRAEMRGFPDLRLVKVEAHVGIEENERADELAGRAAKARRSVAPGR
jgi:ribonuclease HI